MSLFPFLPRMELDLVSSLVFYGTGYWLFIRWPGTSANVRVGIQRALPMRQHNSWAPVRAGPAVVRAKIAHWTSTRDSPRARALEDSSYYRDVGGQNLLSVNTSGDTECEGSPLWTSNPRRCPSHEHTYQELIPPVGSNHTLCTPKPHRISWGTKISPVPLVVSNFPLITQLRRRWSWNNLTMIALSSSVIHGLSWAVHGWWAPSMTGAVVLGECPLAEDQKTKVLRLWRGMPAGWAREDWAAAERLQPQIRLRCWCSQLASGARFEDEEKPISQHL